MRSRKESSGRRTGGASQGLRRDRRRHGEAVHRRGQLLYRHRSGPRPSSRIRPDRQGGDSGRRGDAVRVQHDRRGRRDRHGSRRDALFSSLAGADRGLRRDRGERPRAGRTHLHHQLRQDRAGDAHGGHARERPVDPRVRGAMAAGHLANGRAVDLITIFEGVGARTAGKISDAELKELEDKGAPPAVPAPVSSRRTR